MIVGISELLNELFYMIVWDEHSYTCRTCAKITLLICGLFNIMSINPFIVNEYFHFNNLLTSFRQKLVNVI